MIVCIIHQSRTKARALSRGNSIPLQPKLGKLVARDTLVPSDPFALLAPLHTPHCIHQDRLVLRLQPGTPAATVTHPNCMSQPPSHVSRGSKSRVIFSNPLKLIFCGARCKCNKVQKEEMMVLLQKLFRVSMKKSFNGPQICFMCWSRPLFLYCKMNGCVPVDPLCMSHLK